MDWQRILAAVSAAAALAGGGGYFAGGAAPQQGFDACISVIQQMAATIEKLEGR